jgi:hypothetical protein
MSKSNGKPSLLDTISHISQQKMILMQKKRKMKAQMKHESIALPQMNFAEHSYPSTSLITSVLLFEQ